MAMKGSKCDEVSVQPGYLTLRGAQAWTGMSQRTIKRWIVAGLPVYQGVTGGKLLVKPQDIDQFLQKRQTPKVDLDALVNETLREIGVGKSSRGTEKIAA